MSIVFAYARRLTASNSVYCLMEVVVQENTDVVARVRKSAQGLTKSRITTEKRIEQWGFLEYKDETGKEEKKQKRSAYGAYVQSAPFPWRAAEETCTPKAVGEMKRTWKSYASEMRRSSPVKRKAPWDYSPKRSKGSKDCEDAS